MPNTYEGRGAISPPTPSQYLALAYGREQVRDWEHKHGVKTGLVKFVAEMADVRGRQDYSLIVFSGWMERATDGKLAAGDRAMSDTKKMFFVEFHDPVVNRQGVIIGWKRKE